MRINLNSKVGSELKAKILAEGGIRVRDNSHYIMSMKSKKKKKVTSAALKHSIKIAKLKQMKRNTG